MVELDPERIALRFVNEINRHDLPALLALMAPDFVFVDGLGQEVHGRDKMAEAWRTYFLTFPDYRISIRDHLAVGSLVGLFGTASGTYAVGGELPHGNHWSTPAAWRAVIRNEHVAEWQVYTDSEPVWKVMGVKRY
jgi:ketosteroid isomerase-like protein